MPPGVLFDGNWSFESDCNCVFKRWEKWPNLLRHAIGSNHFLSFLLKVLSLLRSFFFFFCHFILIFLFCFFFFFFFCYSSLMLLSRVFFLSFLDFVNEKKKKFDSSASRGESFFFSTALNYRIKSQPNQPNTHGKCQGSIETCCTHTHTSTHKHSKLREWTVNQEYHKNVWKKTWKEQINISKEEEDLYDDDDANRLKQQHQYQIHNGGNGKTVNGTKYTCKQCFY